MFQFTGNNALLMFFYKLFHVIIHNLVKFDQKSLSFSSNLKVRKKNQTIIEKN